MAEHHVLGLSGGKDSAALAVYMRARHPDLNIRYFFADTGKELPEVYDYLARLEGFLGQPIEHLNRHRGFDFWLRQYNHFLPSIQARWCTRKLKLEPFRNWVRPWLAAGDTVINYVAIRADEDRDDGMGVQHSNFRVSIPFRDHGIGRSGVLDILETAGLGLPKFYEWRSRSGCTFCFFQQKIEWVRLKRMHPGAFEEAKAYEKAAIDHSSPFTWSRQESLTDLERPERMAEIEADFERRKQLDLARRRFNPLDPTPCDSLDIDDLFYENEGGGACLVCHK